MHAAQVTHLVNGDAVHVAHLVELVDAHDTAVSQHHCACFQAALARLRVCRHCSRETDAGAAPARGVEGDRGEVEDEAQHLQKRTER